MAEMQTTVTGGGTQGLEDSNRRGLAASFAAIGTAFLAALCCIGPVLFVTLGIGAGLASRFEPLRPIFTILTVGLITIGFYTVYGRRPASAVGESCDAEGACIVPRSRRREKTLLWIATFVALLLLTFPQWSRLLERGAAKSTGSVSFFLVFV